ncbi:hypothetical protein SAMN05444157_2421 [Frankineae bacterium MT45]|nr:hypothetical protein SAMN05444157_2421 [Frankineae bacterium MT45]
MNNDTTEAKGRDMSDQRSDSRGAASLRAALPVATNRIEVAR